jgi:hypothetical protein
MEVSGQLHNPTAPPRYPLVRRLGWSQSRYGLGGEQKNPIFGPRSGIEPQSFSPLPSLYTDRATLAPVSKEASVMYECFRLEYNLSLGCGVICLK